MKFITSFWVASYQIMIDPKNYYKIIRNVYENIEEGVFFLVYNDIEPS